MKSLPEFAVTLKRVTDATSSTANYRRDYYRLGLRTKLGGTPDWEQGDETQLCPHCGKTMSFVAQIDSVEHDSSVNPHSVDALSDDQKCMFGDVGMIYVFLCFECGTPSAVMQCG